jgi:hypothetical protein
MAEFRLSDEMQVNIEMFEAQMKFAEESRAIAQSTRHLMI